MRSSITSSEIDRVFVGRLLLGRVYGALVIAHDRALAPLGLTVHQALILLNCARGEGNTPAQLAELNGLYVSTITRTADRLESRGLLTRTRSQKDRRQVILRVTEKGYAVLRKAISAGRRVAIHAWQEVTEEEKASLRRTVRKILSNLGQSMGSTR